MRPDRQDFAEPGDLIDRHTMIEGISHIVINDVGWTFSTSSEVISVGHSTLGIVIALTGQHLGEYENTDMEKLSIVDGGHARYIIFPGGIGWWLHTEITPLEKAQQP